MLIKLVIFAKITIIQFKQVFIVTIYGYICRKIRVGFNFATLKNFMTS